MPKKTRDPSWERKGGEKKSFETLAIHFEVANLSLGKSNAKGEEAAVFLIREDPYSVMEWRGYLEPALLEKPAWAVEGEGFPTWGKRNRASEKIWAFLLTS